MKEFDITLCGTRHYYATLRIKAESEAEAMDKALQIAENEDPQEAECVQSSCEEARADGWEVTETNEVG